MHTGTYYHIFDQRQYLSAPFSDINQCRHIANATQWTAQTQAAPLSPKPRCWEKCGLMTQAHRPTCACCYLQHLFVKQIHCQAFCRKSLGTEGFDSLQAACQKAAATSNQSLAAPLLSSSSPVASATVVEEAYELITSKPRLWGTHGSKSPTRQGLYPR